MNEVDTFRLGDKNYPLGRITARRGLTAAFLIAPHIQGLRPIFEDIARQGTSGKATTRLGIGLLMDGLKSATPLLDPDTFLAIASAVTAVPVDELADAPLEDVVAATLKGVSKLDLVGIMTAGVDLFGKAQIVAAAAEES